MLVKNKMGLTLPLLSALLDDCIEKGLRFIELGPAIQDEIISRT